MPSTTADKVISTLLELEIPKKLVKRQLDFDGLFAKDSAVGLQGSASSAYGSYSSGGYKDCEGISIGLLLTALLGIGVLFFTLFTKITMITGRRKKRSTMDEVVEDMDPVATFLEKFQDIAFGGLEEFEDKIDKLAGGVSGGENDGWIGSLYNKLKGQLLPKDASENTIDLDGLEPPVLTESWGLGDVSKLFNNGTEAADSPKTLSASAEKMEEITNEEIELMEELKNEEDDYIRALQGDAKCQAKFWRCVAKVAKGGMKYANEPGGISQLFTKTMFRVAFHGGMGNAWNALMTIPEARKAKRCMNMQEECLNYEVIRSEAGATDAEKPRLIVNPDFVHDIDTSDGATQFDADVQKQFEEQMNEI